MASLSEQERDFFHLFDEIDTNDQDNTATQPTFTMSARLPNEPRVSTVPLTTAAWNFIAKYTTNVGNVPHDEECPVCLESYVVEALEPCVKIKNVSDCACRIGKVCLGELLSKNPGEEKKCPLCRAVWSVGYTSQPRVYGRDGALERLSALQGAFGTVATETNATDAANAAPRTSGGAALLIPARPVARPVIDLIGDDDDLEGEEYTQFTRDLEDLRARARGTQSRRHRNQAAGQRRGRASGTAVAQDKGNQSRSLARPILDPYRLRLGSTSPEARTRAASPPSRRRVHAERRQQISEPDSTIINSTRHDNGPSRAPRSSMNPSRIPFTKVNTAVASIVPAAAPSDVNVSEGPRKSVVPTHEATLNARDKELDKRKADLDKREAGVEVRVAKINKRQVDLDEREKELNKRVKRFEEREAEAHREQQDARSRLLQRHKEELKALSKRQKEELERISVPCDDGRGALDMSKLDYDVARKDGI
ncbi:hypothetical protein ACEQ8H_000631 [Pleosporales sp. CAS-2024a]